MRIPAGRARCLQNAVHINAHGAGGLLPGCHTLMPGAIIDRDGGNYGGIRISDAERKFAADQSGAKIIRNAWKIAIHQPLAIIPLPGSGCLRGFDPEGDAKIIANLIGDLNLTAEAVEGEAAVDSAIGIPTGIGHDSVVVVSGNIRGDITARGI